MTYPIGGRIIVGYTNGVRDFEQAVSLSPFNPTTFVYTEGGLVMPTESDVAETFTALAAVMAAYYDPSWTISIKAIWQQVGGDATMLATIPTVAPVSGTSDTTEITEPGLLRGFTFYSALGSRQRFRLFMVSTNEAGQKRRVTPTLGGFDDRDRALVAYLSGPDTGCRCWDGVPFPPDGSAYVRSMQPGQGTTTTGGGDTAAAAIIVDPANPPIGGPPDPSKPAIYVQTGLAASFAWWPDIEQWIDAGYNSATLPNYGTPVLSDSSPPSVDPGIPRLPTHPITQIWIDQSVTPPQLNYSDDGGGTWTPVGAVPVVANDAPGAIAYNDSGLWSAITAADTTSDLSAGDVVLTLSNDNPPKWSTFNTTTIITPADMANTPPAPPVADNCVQVRCSVSDQCTRHLSSLNTNWAHWLGPLLQAVGTLAFAAVLSQVVDPLFDVAAEGALASYSAIWTTLRPYVVALTSPLVGGFLPSLTSDQEEAIQKSLFCRLTCDGSVVNVSQEQVSLWRGDVSALDVYIPGTLTQVLLDALLQFTPLQDWQTQAQQASTSSACDDWSCE